MRAVFLADAHLQEPTDNNYREIIRFLDGLAGTIDSLYLMGDFFDFWVGAPSYPFPHYGPVLECLKRLVDSGVQLVYLEGNHDFHMGAFFRDRLGATVHTGPVTTMLDGKKVHLCHGDQIDRHDLGTRALRSILHSSFTRWAIHIIPAWLADRIAIWLGRKSKRSYTARSMQGRYPGLVREYAQRQFADGCQTVVTGHFHFPLCEQYGQNTLVVLGDWITHFTYGEWLAGTLTLRRYEHDSMPNSFR
jgi:UDP-2,3-diacylglucosamine hydrolase